MSYGKKEDGTMDFNVEVEESAHFTDLKYLAKLLDFGCELWCCEPGCEFCQHFLVTHNGELEISDHGSYTLEYPEDENGEPNYDAEPTENFELGDYMDFQYLDEIYGDVKIED